MVVCCNDMLESLLGRDQVLCCLMLILSCVAVFMPCVFCATMNAEHTQATADAAEYKAGFDKAAMDAAEYKAGFDKATLDNEGQQARLDKVRL